VVATLTEWHTLAMQLRDEGLIRAPGTGPAAATSTQPAAPGRRERRSGVFPFMGRWTVRLAAGAALLTGGMVIGRGLSIGEGISQSWRTAMMAADSTHGSAVHVRVGDESFSSARQARATLAQSQVDYQAAAAFLAASDTENGTSPAVYRDRLAALDVVANATMTALRNAPGDPLLNQYYISTAAAREATLQQLARSLPDGDRLVQF
jgi:hypothetical protein